MRLKNYVAECKNPMKLKEIANRYNIEDQSRNLYYVIENPFYIIQPIIDNDSSYHEVDSKIRKQQIFMDIYQAIFVEIT
jgi:hypothetical protein